MEALLEEAGRVEAQGNFNRTLENVQRAVDLLKQAKEDISNSKDPTDVLFHPLTLPRKLQACHIGNEA